MFLSTCYPIGPFVIGIIVFIFINFYMERWNRRMEDAARDERKKKGRAHIKNARAMRRGRLGRGIGTSPRAKLNPR